MRVRIARDGLRRLRELTPAVIQLEGEITAIVQRLAPELLAEPGFGPLIAAKLVGEIAGADRFPTAAKLARAAGVARIPASSGNTIRQRLDTGGNPPAQRRAAPRHRHPRPLPHPDARLHRAPAPRRQDHPRSDTHPQALPRPPRLAAVAAAHPRPGNDAIHINLLT